MKKLARLQCSLAVLLLLPCLVWGQQVSLTILHTNDLHSHLLPFSYPEVVSAGSELAGLRTRSNIGGIARRATLVKRMRQELERKGVQVWLVDAGDFSDGTPFSTEYRGEADAAAMNAAGYTFGTLGNHEFNFSFASLQKVLGILRYPLVCANVVDAASGKTLLPPYVLADVGPLKVAVFGILTREAQTYPAAKENVTVSDEIETARRMANTLRSQAGILILLSHAGEAMDRKIAEAVPEIDLIVGGHTHSRLPLGEFVWRSDELKATEVNGTVIVQAHQWGGELGRLDLLFAKDQSGEWRVDRYRERLIPITADIPEDPGTAAVVGKFWQPIAPKYGEVIGKASADFSERGNDLANYNLIADLVRERFRTDIELENVGGIRAPLIKGDITRADIVGMDPFDNTVITFAITGRRLKDLLKKERPAVSGVRYRMENGELVDVTIGGKPVKDNKTYTGATNSYFAGVALKDMKVTDTKVVRREVIAEYIRRKGTVTPLYDGRRIIFGRAAQ